MNRYWKVRVPSSRSHISSCYFSLNPRRNFSSYQVSDFIDTKLAQRITSKEIDFYRKNGYLVLEEALNPKQVELWRKLVDKSVAARGNDHRMPSKGQEDATNVNFDYYLKVFTQRVNLFQTDDDMRELVLKAGTVIGEIACKLEGIKGIRLWHDQALIKEPWANPTSLHLVTYIYYFNAESDFFLKKGYSLLEF